MALVRRSTPEPHAQLREDPADAVVALGGPDPAVRQRAALDLHGIASAVPALLGRVGTETDPTAREAVLTALAGHDTPEVARALVRHLGSDDAGLRTAVVETLATMPAGVTPLLAELVAAPDPDVRILTALILADLPSAGAGQWLVTMVEHDPHPNVVAAAVDALLPLAGEEHAALLARARDRFPDDPFLRFTVDAALPGLAGAHAAVPPSGDAPAAPPRPEREGGAL